MCSKPKTPKIQQVEMPSAPAAPPPPEPIADAPAVAEGSKRRQERTSKKRGTSALRIDLTSGSVPLKGSGLSLPT